MRRQPHIHVGNTLDEICGGVEFIIDELPPTVTTRRELRRWLLDELRLPMSSAAFRRLLQRFIDDLPGKKEDLNEIEIFD